MIQSFLHTKKWSVGVVSMEEVRESDFFREFRIVGEPQFDSEWSICL